MRSYNTLSILSHLWLPVIWFMSFLPCHMQSQTILLLQNQKNLKNFKYYPGNDIRLKTFKTKKILQGTIYRIEDSVILIGDKGTVKLDEIAIVYREKNWPRILSGASLLGGVAYFGIDSFNRLINNQAPTVDQETLIISGSLIAFSGLMWLFMYRPIHINERWKLSVLDFSSGPGTTQ
jgi:hypothetical protein